MGGNSRSRDFGAVFVAESALWQAQKDAERAASLRQQAADAEATRYLAEMACPQSVTEFGRRHDILTFAEFTWQHGFMAGWRAAQTRKADGTSEEC